MFTQVQAHVITSWGWLCFLYMFAMKRFRADSRGVNLVLPSSQNRRTISLPSTSQGSHIFPLNFNSAQQTIAMWRLLSHTIIQIYTAVGIIKIIKMRGRHCAQCLVNYHRFYHQKSLWELLNSNRPSLSGSATGMANFTFDVHLGMIVIYDNLETEWIVIYMTIC